ncbi:hypothetical protein CO670_15440 [Rhizobium sp. J15]|uniref:response regulator transcription factor n=1 Tax=Rhizobium sp. J15 TaxID=2035450 RepID=UPI000BE8784B|nr:response regulator transcription factor [Rhizobium sp. J15]PDT15887.1 hypothetical protein CO670_15440 [Rhizobium sp. J15]
MNMQTTIRQCPLDTTDKEIIKMLAEGRSRKDIAFQRHVSESAICQRIQSASKMLRIPRKDAALVAVAFRNGWLS